MKVTEVTRQQAGECADALRKILRAETTGDSDILYDCERYYLRDLLTALEDAERGHRDKDTVTVKDVGTIDLGPGG